VAKESMVAKEIIATLNRSQVLCTGTILKIPWGIDKMLPTTDSRGEKYKAFSKLL
jgi:hypothetical protein